MIPKDDENEMSMEEILASIRRYVADDEPELNQTGIEYSSGHTAEVIRLTDAIDINHGKKKSDFTPFVRVQEQTPPPTQTPAQEQRTASMPQMHTPAEPYEHMFSDHQIRQEAPSSYTPAIHEPVILPFQKGGFSPPVNNFQNQQSFQEQTIQQQDFSDVITERTMNSTSSAFSKLSEAFQMAKAEKQHHDAQKNHGASPIESFVIELAKPMVRQWIEEHLPSLVDRLVTQEIEKLTEEMRKKIF
jgi:cell pole-organizing protein PopZ